MRRVLLFALALLFLIGLTSASVSLDPARASLGSPDTAEDDRSCSADSNSADSNSADSDSADSEDPSGDVESENELDSEIDPFTTETHDPWLASAALDRVLPTRLSRPPPPVYLESEEPPAER